MEISRFRKLIGDYYRSNKRDLPWRNTHDTYRIFVSEIMLQQTQVVRVLKKYPEFLDTFPDFDQLSAASTEKLLNVWQGMGYNRRALSLRSSAQVIVDQYNGIVPNSHEELLKLPGIGPGTAGSLLAFVYNEPVVFIETNIRRVFLHFFFPDQQHVDDRKILPHIEDTLDRSNPREWYYALMDYGSMLPKVTVNANRRSKHYTVQSTFEGSDRQIRGAVIRALLATPRQTVSELSVTLSAPQSRLKPLLDILLAEGFIRKASGKYLI